LWLNFIGAFLTIILSSVLQAFVKPKKIETVI